MDGSYGPAAQKVETFVASLENGHHRAHQNVGQTADFSAMADQILIHKQRPRRDQHKEESWTRYGGGRFCYKATWMGFNQAKYQGTEVKTEFKKNSEFNFGDFVS